MRTFTHPLLATLPSVLVIGMESKARTRFHRLLRRAKFRTFVCAQLRDAIDLMQLVSVVVCHQPLDGFRWREVLLQAESLRNPPSVVVTIPRPLTLDLDEANQAGVFALLEPYYEAEISALIQRAHTEYQAVRQLQSAHADGLTLFEQLRASPIAAPAATPSESDWPETSSTVRFRAADRLQRESATDLPEPVSVN